MSPLDLKINWFDLIVLAVLVAGVVVGRKRGMSAELLVLLQWLAIVFVGAVVYNPVGRMLADFSGFSPVVTYITAYLLAAALMKGVFFMLKQMAGEKLVSSDVFGSFEYYLGMAAGATRFACILIFALALLHAPSVSDAELSTQIRKQQESLGSIYFPPFGSIQRAVFQGSFTGRLVELYLPSQLISVDPAAGGVSRDNIGKMREREVNEVLRPTK
jgi:uncharacterized membrane protein required for colicin V production